GTALLDGPGSPADFAARLRPALEAVGLRAGTARPAEGPRGALQVPLRHRSGALAGALRVAPAEAGSRALLSLHPAGR
ncbi:MAG: hypothetical protein D6731_24740, partial [Planctomycetota bacterium]